jgi:segregation and condensation protein A
MADETLTDIALPTGYTIKLQVFEGPLDLLLHLIREHKIDIYDIPIAQITEQYLRYLSLMESLDLNVAGEFFLMAATLLEIKSRLLLPVIQSADESEEEMDPRTELVERLLEYERFKNASLSLQGLEDERRQMYWRITDELKDYEAPVIPMNLQAMDLIYALQRMLQEVGEGEQEVTSIQRQRVSLRMKMSEIWRKIHAAGLKGEKVGFEELLPQPTDRQEIIMTFLALLELLRMQKIRINQRKTLGEINISAIPDTK